MSAGAHETRSAQFLLLREYLERLWEAERDVALRLGEFANEAGDDTEVQALLSSHVQTTVQQQGRLAERLAELGGAPGDESSSANSVSPFGFAPQIGSASKTSEERLLHNIVAAYTAECGEAAMCEQVAQLALSARDNATEQLARDLERESLATADKLWHFIPTRSKIAFNMLTVSELDPAVETKLADDRIES